MQLLLVQFIVSITRWRCRCRSLTLILVSNWSSLELVSPGIRRRWKSWEVIIAGEDLRTSRAHRVSRSPPGITGPFGLKPMCNDVETKRENVVSFCRYRLLSTPEQRLGSASILERPESPVFPCFESLHETVRTQTRDYSKRNLALVKLVVKQKTKIRI